MMGPTPSWRINPEVVFAILHIPLYQTTISLSFHSHPVWEALPVPPQSSPLHFVGASLVVAHTLFNVCCLWHTSSPNNKQLLIIIRPSEDEFELDRKRGSPVLPTSHLSRCCCQLARRLHNPAPAEE